MVDTHYGDADWLSSPFFELRRLIYEVILYSVDLLNHRFREDFYFHADFDRCELSARYGKSGVFDRDPSRNDLAEGSVPTSGDYTATPIARVHHALMGSDPSY
jgi:hypothetical protein